MNKDRDCKSDIDRENKEECVVYTALQIRRRIEIGKKEIRKEKK